MALRLMSTASQGMEDDTEKIWGIVGNALNEANNLVHLTGIPNQNK